METVSHGTLDPWWVTGLVDGQGSFTYNRNGSQISVVFQVKLTSYERPILERIQTFFQVGNLYDVKGATKSALMYRVIRRNDLPNITAHFEQYPLQTFKRTVYEIWREMVQLKQEFRGRNQHALEDLALQLSEAQIRNPT